MQGNLGGLSIIAALSTSERQSCLAVSAWGRGRVGVLRFPGLAVFSQNMTICAGLQSCQIGAGMQLNCTCFTSCLDTFWRIDMPMETAAGSCTDRL